MSIWHPSEIAPLSSFNADVDFGAVPLLDDPLKLVLPLAVVAEALYGGSSPDAG